MTWPIIYNTNWVIIVFIIWVIMMLMSHPKVTFINPHLNYGQIWRKFFIILFLFVTITGLHRWDTYHMAAWWPTHTFHHFEPFHLWIINTFAYNSYFLYRLIVFGFTGILFWILAKRLDNYSNNFYLATTLFLVDSMFSEMRGTIGVMVMVWGLSVLVKQRESISMKKFILLIIIASTYFMHRSMLLTLLLAFVALVISINKKTIVISWFLFPLFVILANILLNSYLSGGFDLSFGDELQMDEKATLYASGARMERTLIGKISNFVEYSPLYLSFFYLSKEIGNKKVILDKSHYYLFKLFYVCVYVASILSFVETSTWLFVRINVVALYPLPFVMAKVWDQEKRSSLWTKLIIIMGCISTVFSLSYRLYIWN